MDKTGCDSFFDNDAFVYDDGRSLCCFFTLPTRV